MKRLLFWFMLAAGLPVLSACAIQGQPASIAKPAQPAAAELLLSDYHWVSQSIENTATPYPVELTFFDQRLVVTGLCNNISAGYHLQGQKMRIQHPASTMRMCDDLDLMHYEQKIASQLEEISTWSITKANAPTNPTLNLILQDGSQWQLQGRPTYEAKYGDSVTIFLEVQPQLFACKHPLINDRLCLKVRTLTYDATGIKQDAGEWQLFNEKIESYTHEAGIRNVLRVKRYTRNQVPADTSRYVYVLDMVVESERVP